jgi:phosphate transport system substrate-binding protein
VLKRCLTVLVAAASLIGAGGAAAEISGAGATFPAPVYDKWAESYQAETGKRLYYQAIGSGAGVHQVAADIVDFGATDRPLEPDELVNSGFAMFPTVVGGIVPVVNLPGIAPGQLRLPGALLADIFRGAVRNWNDPLIARYNPDVRLPNLPITVVRRADRSGTTFLFTTYLSWKAPRWASDVGAGDEVLWPVGVGARFNEGVAAYVRRTPGAIGYVEYAFAKENDLAHALVQNKAGKYVAPGTASFSAAAANANWKAAPGFYLLLLDQPAAEAWPITGASFILVKARQEDAAKGREVLAFFDWAYKNGDAAAAQLDYLPMPAAVKDMVRKSWSKVTGPDGKPVYR